MYFEAMTPLGKALLAYFEGDTEAEIIIRRDDGQETPVPVSLFFRDQSRFSPIDQAAVDECRGHILDAGAGTGPHSLALNEKGLAVTAIDISPEAVKIMKRRGLEDVRREDVFDLRQGAFDTVLMLGHGIGMVETIGGLDRFLAHAHHLISEYGQVLLDSLDVRCTEDPVNLAYHESNRQTGRYIGEIRMQVEFRGETGPYLHWLMLCEVLHRLETGDYLARLTRSASM
jgi:SAM-dependent methyltransferase